ncbi:Glycosyltransferase family 9 (heptosyltransferase) [Streptosporangium canum]|uniref:Glycosyltransferase family 9 (Heptosyltransferase) n=2 Tax=Streptosporangium canum TaxID=324952 RepID=A0A1I4ED80_9ACTN|nr:Glycosyltransferase family 9 (heptosyltransferase) [Streptosporangium canum]
MVVLRGLGLGDLLTAVPALRALRRAHPGHRIVLAAPASLAPLVPLIGAVDGLLDVSGPGPVPLGVAPDIAVNLHGRGPQSLAALRRTGPGRLLTHAHPDFPEVPGPPWRGDAHEVRRWCDLLGWYGVAADPGDLELEVPPGWEPPPVARLWAAGPAPEPVSASEPEPAAVDSGAAGPGSEGFPPGAGPGPYASPPDRPDRPDRPDPPDRPAPAACRAPAGRGAARPGPRVPRSRRPAPVVLHPGAAAPARRWPPERFALVSLALRQAGHEVVITGSAGERVLAEQVASLACLPEACVLAGRTGLRDLVALVARARLVVCGDTGVAHLASALATPSVVLFGPVSPALWGPPHGPHVALWAGRSGDPHGDLPDEGLLEIGVLEVLDAAVNLLEVGVR